MAIAIGSMVVQGNFGSPGQVLVPYGYVFGGSAGAWSVQWSNGVITPSIDDASVLELTYPFKSNDLLRKRVRPNRGVDPQYIGTVIMQDGIDILVVDAPIGKYVIGKVNAKEVV